MSRELALFRSAPSVVNAGEDAARAPDIAPQRLYAIALIPQALVSFAQPPGGRRTADNPRAGLLEFTVVHSGHYRVSADGPVWIDIVAGEVLLTASGYIGHRNCALIHKSVDVELPADARLILQLSQSPSQRLHIAITAVPNPAGEPRRPS